MTTIIVLLNTTIFIFTSFIGGLTNPNILYELGGISLDYIVEKEYYRLISSAFIHNGFMHFLLNIGYIIITAPPIEKVLRKQWFLLLFLFTVLGSSLFTVMFNGDVTVGSSGFGYGILGFYFSILIWRQGLIDKESRLAIIVLISIVWILTFFIEHISVLGHLGGFVVGVIFGWIFTLNLENTKIF
nr:rhomboid family intramembrane serine protease [Halobacillus sp. A1]